MKKLALPLFAVSALLAHTALADGKTVWTKQTDGFTITCRTNCPDAVAEISKPVRLSVTVDAKTPGFFSTRFYQDGKEIGNKMYVVETKGDNMAQNPDVHSKETSAVDWVAKINELPESERMGCEWSYVLLTGGNFDALRSQNASIQQILDYCRLTRTRAQGTLI